VWSGNLAGLEVWSPRPEITSNRGCIPRLTRRGAGGVAFLAAGIARIPDLPGDRPEGPLLRTDATIQFRPNTWARITRSTTA